MTGTGDGDTALRCPKTTQVRQAFAELLQIPGSYFATCHKEGRCLQMLLLFGVHRASLHINCFWDLSVTLHNYSIRL